MIEVNALSKAFGGFQALDQVSIHVEKGSVYGLVGPNGAGKSTLIRHLTGVYRPDAGNVFVDDQPVYNNPAVKSKILCIYDDIYYSMQATTRDLMRLYRGLYPSFDMERYRKLREVFPEVKETAPLRSLSKGMLKQSAFWLAMSCRPEILLLDEPVDGLDPVMRRQILSILMGDVAEQGTTVLLSSHNLRELEDICDHVGILHHGKVLLERSLSELQDSICKIQILFGDAPPQELPGLKVLHESSAGRLKTYIIRSAPDAALAKLSVYNPLYSEALPLTLEEIFIYELGGMSYAVQDILV